MKKATKPQHLATANPANTTAETMAVLSVETAKHWHRWLAANHAKSTGVWLRIPKGAARAFGYKEALDEALVWGWIDSQKRPLDAEAWLQRFSPRKPKSLWSKINRTKVEALIAAGRMKPQGLAEIDRAKQDGRWEGAYDSATSSGVPEDLAAALARVPRAKKFFETVDSANRYAILFRVQTAKKPETRARWIERLVAMCASGETIHPKRTK